MTVASEATDYAAGTFDELSRVLWKQRELIDLLQYRLEIQQMVLISSRAERLQLALSEVEAAMASIREVEENRDQIVRQCAELVGLDYNATITQLREAIPEPWKTLLGDHQKALLDQVAETERTANSNREFAVRGANEVRGVLNEITGNVPTVAYGPNGGRVANTTLARPALLDREV